MVLAVALASGGVTILVVLSVFPAQALAALLAALVVVAAPTAMLALAGQTGLRATRLIQLTLSVRDLGHGNLGGGTLEYRVVPRGWGDRLGGLVGAARAPLEWLIRRRYGADPVPISVRGPDGDSVAVDAFPEAVLRPMRSSGRAALAARLVLPSTDAHRLPWEAALATAVPERERRSVVWYREVGATGVARSWARRRTGAVVLRAPEHTRPLLRDAYGSLVQPDEGDAGSAGQGSRVGHLVGRPVPTSYGTLLDVADRRYGSGSSEVWARPPGSRADSAGGPAPDDYVAPDDAAAAAGFLVVQGIPYDHQPYGDRFEAAELVRFAQDAMVAGVRTALVIPPLWRPDATTAVRRIARLARRSRPPSPAELVSLVAFLRGLIRQSAGDPDLDHQIVLFMASSV